FTTATTATWLAVTPTSGSSGSSVSVSVNPSGLAAGTYSGNVTITSSGASNSPKSIPVTLTVTAAALPTLAVSPLNLSFNYQTGGTAPTAQNVSLTSSSGTLSYTTTSSAT